MLEEKSSNLVNVYEGNSSSDTANGSWAVTQLAIIKFRLGRTVYEHKFRVMDCSHGFDQVEKRYNVSIADEEEVDYYEIRNEIAKNTGCLISGGNINEQKVSDILLRDFRTGKLGKITIENI